MLGLIALMVLTLIVMLVMRQGWKRILIAFVGFLVVMGVFNLYVTKTCGPNAKDVEIMTPQAEAISNYILKNGIPESMAGIPNLPYPLGNCKKATDGTNVENCYFSANSTKIDLELYITGDGIFITAFNKKSETVVTFLLERSNQTIKLKDYKADSRKNNGICNPMRM